MCEYYQMGHLSRQTGKAKDDSTTATICENRGRKEEVKGDNNA